MMGSLRNHTFFDIAELNEAIKTKLTELNNKPFQKLEGSRRSLFETIDRPALKPLPFQAYEFAIWKKAKVNIDYHVEFETNYYSVPYKLIKQEVDLRVTRNMVEAFFKGRRVAGHPRSFGKRQYIT
jgi:transposase